MQDLNASQNDSAFPIVCIGSSAGGLEACMQLLAALPAQTGMAFVLVQHLDPQHDSRLVDVLGKVTRMRVTEAEHGLSVEPDHVYVIAPNTTLGLAADGTLEVAPRGERSSSRQNLPIDQFFRSLAASHAGAAIGVVLSGTGTDGTLGLEEIKAAGGITFAQDEASAKFSGMPLSAFHSGCVDLVLPPERIAAELARIGGLPYLTPGRPSEGAAPARMEGDDQHFKTVLALLRAANRVDFSAYRDTTIKRRIMRRVLLSGGDSLAAYVQRLEGDRGELDALYQDILINVTRFFREAEVFETLKQRVFPDILAARSGETPIRLWVPGCSTGQEAYSLAIALLEFLDDKPVHPPVQIFATDLSEGVSLQRGRAGLYPASIENEVSPERLRRFFLREDGHYRISKTLREMVVFARQNVATDPPFSRVDLVSCRNLLIYLSPPLQKRVIPTFHYALNPGGFLLLGASETIGPHSDLFAVVDQPHRIYARKSATTPRPYPHFRTEGHETRLAGAHEPPVPARPLPGDWQREADRVAAGQYVPPGVLINDDFDILQFRGQTGSFLAPAAGEPSHNLLKMARDGLFVAVRSAVIECQRSGASVRQPDVRIRGEGVDRQIDLHVMPVKLPQAGERCYLVLFEETARRATPPVPPPGEPAPGLDAAEAQRLRQELAATREYLQSLIEQQDAANEELKSANEEILSSNEELQSTNEELETAKEELQSINEELTTVNEQLQHRNVELARLNDDTSNMLASSGVAKVVLGTALRIRRFTPAAAKLLGLLAGDIGRPIGHLNVSIDLPDLEAMAGEVIASVQPQEREVRGPDGRCYQLRINPYRTADNRIDGVVLVLFDIDELRSTQAALEEERDYASAIVETVGEPLLVLDAQLRVQSANRAFYENFAVRPQDTEGRLLYELGNRQWDIPVLREQLSAVLAGGNFTPFDVRHEFEAIGPRVMRLNARRVVRVGTRRELILLAFDDRTAVSRLEERSALHLAELHEQDRLKTAFLALLAHELRNPLAPIRSALHVLDRADGSDEALARRMRATVERQVTQMARLVDDLLDVARINKGRIEVFKHRLDLVAQLREGIEAAQASCESRSIALSASLPDEPVWIDADETRLSQVVGNLLGNASKFTDPGGSIMLTLEVDDGEAVIRVRDSGIGMTAEQLGRVFDMFMQVDSSLERSRSGLGLGLTLVKQLVEAHGGTVSAASGGIGQGSEFVLRLPLPQGPAPGEQDAQPRTEADAVAPPERPRHRILVVDDNSDGALALAMALGLHGHEVRTAADGPAALSLAEAWRPRVVLLDIGLPGMNGYDVARRLGERPWRHEMRLIALTGWGQPEDRRRSDEAGFDAHLVKPVDLLRLTTLLATVG